MEKKKFIAEKKKKCFPDEWAVQSKTWKLFLYSSIAEEGSIAWSSCAVMQDESCLRFLQAAQ